MHGRLLKKKSKPMIPFNHFQNIVGTSLDAAIHILSHLRKKLCTTFLLTLLRLNLSLSVLLSLLRSELSPTDNKKTDKELIGEFLWWGVCCCMGIKDFLPK